MDEILEIAHILRDDPRTYTLGTRLMTLQNGRLTFPCKCRSQLMCYDHLHKFPNQPTA